MGSSHCKRVDTAIARAKNLLIQRAAEEGIYENFGQREAWEIENHFLSFAEIEDVYIIKAKVNAFRDWCMTYTPYK